MAAQQGHCPRSVALCCAASTHISLEFTFGISQGYPRSFIPPTPMPQRNDPIPTTDIYATDPEPGRGKNDGSTTVLYPDKRHS